MGRLDQPFLTTATISCWGESGVFFGPRWIEADVCVYVGAEPAAQSSLGQQWVPCSRANLCFVLFLKHPWIYILQSVYREPQGCRALCKPQSRNLLLLSLKSSMSCPIQHREGCLGDRGSRGDWYIQVLEQESVLCPVWPMTANKLLTWDASFSLSKSEEYFSGASWDTLIEKSLERVKCHYSWSFAQIALKCVLLKVQPDIFPRWERAVMGKPGRGDFVPVACWLTFADQPPKESNFFSKASRDADPLPSPAQQ